MSTTSLEQDLHNRLPKAPDLIYCTARGHWPVPSAAQSTPTSNRLKPTDGFFVNAALKSASTEKFAIAQLHSNGVTLRSDEIFAPYVAVTAQACAVTAPKLTRIAPFGDFIKAFSIVKIGLSQLT